MMMGCKASSPCAQAAGPDCRMSGDSISCHSTSRTAGTSAQPGFAATCCGRNFMQFALRMMRIGGSVDIICAAGAAEPCTRRSDRSLGGRNGVSIAQPPMRASMAMPQGEGPQRGGPAHASGAPDLVSCERGRRRTRPSRVAANRHSRRPRRARRRWRRPAAPGETASSVRSGGARSGPGHHRAPAGVPADGLHAMLTEVMTSDGLKPRAAPQSPRVPPACVCPLTQEHRREQRCIWDRPLRGDEFTATYVADGSAA